MKRVHIPLAAFAVAVLALGACGDDDGGDTPDDSDPTEETSGSDDTDATDDTSATDDTEASDDESSSDVPDEVRDAFPNATDEQLSCLAESGDDINTDDMGAITDLLEECGIEMDDLVPGGVSIPSDVSLPDISEVMANLTPDQLECLGTEGANLDPTDTEAVFEVLEACGVDVADLTGG